MKAFSYMSYIMACFIALTFGCDTSLDPSEWDENWHFEQVCYTVYLENSHQPIQEATISLINYDHPDCSGCPLDLQLATDAHGEVCITMSEGWTCNSAMVSAEGFVSHTFTGKPPAIIYLSPVVN